MQTRRQWGGVARLVDADINSEEFDDVMVNSGGDSDRFADVTHGWFPVVVLAVLLAGCSGPAPSPSATPTTVASTPTTTPSPVVSTATEKEVGSVVAGYIPDATKTIEGAGECRILSVSAKTAAEQASLLACYTNEITLGLSSSTTAKKLRTLTPPDSMRSLVTQTITALENVSAIDLEKQCGPAMTKPAGTPTCNAALGSRYSAYQQLKGVLASWSPFVN